MPVRKTDMNDHRLLRVLEALNTIGSCTVLDLARSTGISRPAVYRAVDHLCRGGYAQRVPGNSRVRLTSKVRALSAGYRDDDWIVEVGAPILAQLQKEVRWPSSLATADKDRMVVRETTRYRSPFVFDVGGVGIRLPMLASSLGLAYVAFCAANTRQIILNLLRQSKDAVDAPARRPKELERLLKTTQRRGYGFRQGVLVAATSSIAVPIMVEGDALGSVCVTYASSAVTQRQAVTEFLPRLRAAAAAIVAGAARKA